MLGKSMSEPPQDNNNDNTNPDNSSNNGAITQIVVDWEAAQAVLYVIQERVSLLIGRQLRLDEDIHIAVFHELFQRDRLGFWTIVDQLYDYFLTLDWFRVSDDAALIQYLLHAIQPLPCPMTEAEFVQILLLKLWPQSQPQSQQQDMFSNEENGKEASVDSCKGNDFDKGETNGVSGCNFGWGDAGYDSTSVENDKENNCVDVGDDDDDEEEEEEKKRLAREEIVRMAVDNVYTWEAAERIAELVNEEITAKVGREIRLDRKHMGGLHAIYERDPLGFWSVFDQIQDKMMKSDWTEVRNDARFIQSFMNKYEPTDVLLTPFMAAVIPQHSLVPRGYPPHVLYREDISTFKPVCKTNCLYNSKAYKKQQQQMQQQQQQQSQEMEEEQQTCQYQHHQMNHLRGNTNQPQPQPQQQQQQQEKSPRIGESPSQSPQIRQKPYQRSAAAATTTTTTIIPSPTYKQQVSPSLPPQQQQQQQKYQDHFPYTWAAAVRAINEIEAQVKSEYKSIDCVFEEKHKEAMRARWEADPKSFFSVLDQMHTKFSQVNWDAVTTKSRFVGTIIAKYEPQSVLSKFIQKFITPPDVAAATAKV